MDTQISDLRAIAADVATYFQTKLPLDKTIDLWFRKLDTMNLRAAHHRIVDIITNGDTAPRNFPAAVKTAYSLWLRDQPRERQEGGCQHCIRGLMHGVKSRLKDDNDTGLWNMYVFRCGHCNKSIAYTIPATTKLQLEEHGYRLDWQHGFEGPGRPEMRERVKRLANTPEIPREQRPESEPEIPF